MDELTTMVDFAARVGVTRQGIDQALARASNPPKPVTVLGQMRIYRLDDLAAWWETRTQMRWQERRARSRRRAIQLNVRVAEETMELLDARRGTNETRSAAGARILREALTDGDTAR